MAGTHARKSASAAERWINCPGSIPLIESLGILDEEESEYAAEGTLAHKFAEECLSLGCEAYEIADQYPDDMAVHVQTYLDFIRSLTVEPGVLHIADLKYGIGVQKDATGNPQMMYYAYGLVLEDDITGRDGVELQIKPFHKDAGGTIDYFKHGGGCTHTVRMTIVQPRGFHPDGPIRTWECSLDELMFWAEGEMLPAIQIDSKELQAGEWCKFCPAVLSCPKMQQGFEALTAPLPIEEGGRLSDETLADQAALIVRAKAYIKALESQLYTRLSRGAKIPGWKLVPKVAHRVWKEKDATGATIRDRLMYAYQTRAFTEPELRSPAEIEKLPGGKDLTAELAYKPETGYTVAPETDKRVAVAGRDPVKSFTALKRS